ncbi:unnamed protein product [marine sediment metagenome]|uniref:Uncharacterized protein n=1 Tax=marine sediment metagenome TaxID=412755 RepID=X1DR78_9ZZZZ
MSNYYNSLKSQLEHILGDDVGYKRYREMDDIFANEIREVYKKSL